MGAGAIAVGVGAAATLAGAYMSSQAAGDAASTQAAAANNASGNTLAQYNQTRSDLAPFRGMGLAGLGTLLSSLGIQPQTQTGAPNPLNTPTFTGGMTGAPTGGGLPEGWSIVPGMQQVSTADGGYGVPDSMLVNAQGQTMGRASTPEELMASLANGGIAAPAQMQSQAPTSGGAQFGGFPNLLAQNGINSLAAPGVGTPNPIAGLGGLPTISAIGGPSSVSGVNGYTPAPTVGGYNPSAFVGGLNPTAFVGGYNPSAGVGTPERIGTFNPTQAELEKTPGYQFNLAQGLNAVQNSNAAKGLGLSGAGIRGAARYATGLADNTLKTQADIFNQNAGILQNNVNNVLSYGLGNATINQANNQQNLAYQQANANINQLNNQQKLDYGLGNANINNANNQANLAYGLGNANIYQANNQSNLAYQGKNADIAQNNILNSLAFGQANADIQGRNAANILSVGQTNANIAQNNAANTLSYGSTNADITRNNINAILAQLMGLSQMGQGAASQTGQFGAAATGAANSFSVGGANALAAGQVGGANAVSGALSGLGGQGMNYLLYQRLLNGGTQYLDSGAFSGVPSGGG